MIGIVAAVVYGVVFCTCKIGRNGRQKAGGDTETHR